MTNLVDEGPDPSSLQAPKKLGVRHLGTLRRGGLGSEGFLEPDGEPEIIEDVEASGLLASPDSWEDPGPDWVTIRFSATAGGVQAYAGMPH